MQNSSNSALPMIFFGVWLVLLVITLAAAWRIFTKAGKPGWYSLVPILNLYQLLLIVKKPWWWIIMFFIPWVNIVFSLLLSLEVAKAFGKSGAFGAILLWLFPIGYYILGFGGSKYIYSQAKVAPAAPPMPQS